MSEVMEFLLIGSGQQLIASADLLRTRGHQVRGVISDCPEVSAWALQKGVARLAPGDSGEQARWLTERRCDYLLSIVNHAITAPEVLAAPARGAINYHDSPLPAYAGFNATAWAIIDGKPTHAVTWHEMTADVDGGRVLVQRAFDIGEDDTAFTLSAITASPLAPASSARVLPRKPTESTCFAGPTRARGWTPREPEHDRRYEPDMARHNVRAGRARRHHVHRCPRIRLPCCEAFTSDD
jgi:folate-dependent phosphoribosylglycinamide formyltransferase PurN